MIGLLLESLAFQKEKQTLVPSCLSGSDHGLGAGTNIAPDFRPHFSGGASERPGMFRAQRHLPVGVVIEKREVRAPTQPHRIARIEHDSHDGSETLRPICCRTDWRLGPVKRSRTLMHFAVTSVSFERIGLVRKRSALGHRHTFLRWSEVAVANPQFIRDELAITRTEPGFILTNRNRLGVFAATSADVRFVAYDTSTPHHRVLTARWTSYNSASDSTPIRNHAYSQLCFGSTS
jgi:hypothetical protein